MTQATVARLGRGDVAALGRLLEQDPIHNVYLRSELRMTPPSGQWWAVSTADGLRSALLGGALVVPWIPEPADAAMLADALRPQQPAPRMMVGPRDSVIALHQALHPEREARHLRDPQPVMSCDASTFTPAAPGPLRRAGRADLDRLVVAAAAMHHEEMGIDPLAVDAPGWWTRMTTLVDRGWSWIWVENDEIIFKTELSAWTPECAQLQGVYVTPDRRRRGIAAAGLSAVVGQLLRDVPRCCLYVNDYNVTARRVYHRLGFHEHGAYATIIY